MEEFRAATQYLDWQGEAAADEADINSLHALVHKRQLLEQGEFIVGVSFYRGENTIQAAVLVIDAEDWEEASNNLVDLEELRSVDVELTLEEFFSLFKRFSIAMAWKGLPVLGREFRED